MPVKYLCLLATFDIFPEKELASEHSWWEKDHTSQNIFIDTTLLLNDSNWNNEMYAPPLLNI